MNETSELPQLPPDVLLTAYPCEQPPKFNFGHWGRRLMVCNPFYLLSVAMLLFGCYRISIEPALFDHEAAHLFFNFSSLQVYELLLILTAIFLFRKNVSYDSMLLVLLENILLLVPFILISQAALINSQITWTLCFTGGAIALSRSAALQRWIRTLNWGPQMLVPGALILIANAALPAIYRTLHESKVGTHPDWGAAYYMNLWSWWLILPVLCSAAFSAVPLRAEKPSEGQHRWPEIVFVTIWILGTGVHLYCLGYVYDFNLRAHFLAPVLWTSSWIAFKRAPELVPNFPQRAWLAGLSLPLILTFVAFSRHGHKVFFVLTVLNLLIYRLMSLRHSAACQLFMFSMATLVAGFPGDWLGVRGAEASRGWFVGIAAVAYLMLQAMICSNPKAALFGSLISGCGTAIALSHNPAVMHWAAQAGTVFLLLHSLRWRDHMHPGAAMLRVVGAGAWLADSLFWSRSNADPLTVASVAVIVMIGYLVARLVSKSWGPRVIAVAALLVLLSPSGNIALSKLHTVPIGLLAIVGSFLLFLLGTVAALTRRRWQGGVVKN